MVNETLFFGRENCHLALLLFLIVWHLLLFTAFNNHCPVNLKLIIQSFRHSSFTQIMHQVIIKRSVTEKCWKWNDQDSHSSFGRQFNLLLRQTEWLKFIYTLRYKLVSTVVRDLNWISTNKANCSHYVHTSTSTIVETALLYLVIPQHPFCQLTASVPRSSITFIRKWC